MSEQNENLYSIKLRAGNRRTYFFDVRATKSNDYFVTLTESKRRFNGDGYDRHKIFLYKEDFNKFLKGLTETIDHIKTELMPDFDFDSFNHNEDENYHPPASITTENTPPAPTEVDVEPVNEVDVEPVNMEAQEMQEKPVPPTQTVENPTSNDEAETW